MHAALTWLMTGQRQADSGDELVDMERRAGYVTFDILLAALEQANRPISEAIRQMDRTLTREIEQQTRVLADRLSRHEEESHDRDNRLMALERWQRQQEVDEAFRKGFWHVILLGFRYLVEHWPAMLSLMVGLVGIVWVIVAGGRPGIEGLP